MATRLAWFGVVLATFNALPGQAQELLQEPNAVPIPRSTESGIEAVADLIRAGDHLEAAGAAELARQVRQQAKFLLKQESDRIVKAQSRLQQLRASLPGAQFRIVATISEVRETTAQDLHCAIQNAAGENAVGEQDGCVWTVDCDCSSELIQHLSGGDTSRVKILSQPHMLALDGQAAAIQMGQTFPVIQGVTIVDGRASPQMRDQSFGIEVSLTPQLIDGENARFDVRMESSTLTTEVPIYTDPANGETYFCPVKDIRLVQTTARLKSGGTLVVAIPAKVESPSSSEESPPLLLLIATPRLIEAD